MGVPKKPAVYVLPHGIEVVGEYPPRGQNRYWRVRVRPHPFFSAPNVSGGLYIRRSRVVMASVIGRALLPSEHVHHKNENVDDDSPENLELITAQRHNAHHKKGSAHTEKAKRKIQKSLKLAYEEGRHRRPQILARDEKGRIKQATGGSNA
jgi:hypothetical protein